MEAEAKHDLEVAFNEKECFFFGIGSGLINGYALQEPTYWKYLPYIIM